MDADSGAPKDELHPETLVWLKTLGVEYTKLSEVLAAGPCPKVSKFDSQDICPEDRRLISQFPHIFRSGRGSCSWCNHTCQRFFHFECAKNPKIRHTSTRFLRADRRIGSNAQSQTECLCKNVRWYHRRLVQNIISQLDDWTNERAREKNEGLIRRNLAK